jgi:hypothetical protein
MNETTKRFQCRHIFTDGRRCASPCLRGEEFCYYHHTTRRPIANPKQRRTRQSTFHLPLPEDRSAIQSSIGEVLRRIATNEIDPRRAGLLLYGLQIASLNLPAPAKAMSKPSSRTTYRDEREDPAPEEQVEEIVIDPALGTLAPRTEIHEAEQPLSTVGRLIQRLNEKAMSSPNTHADILPEVQATAPVAPYKQTRHPRRFCRNARPLRPAAPAKRPIIAPPFSRNARPLPPSAPAKRHVISTEAKRRGETLYFAFTFPSYLSHQTTLVS